MTESDWEKAQRHRDLLRAQERVQDAIWDQTHAIEMAAVEQSEVLAAGFEGLIESANRDREFKIFWDSLTFSEKRQFRVQYEREQEALRLAEEEAQRERELAEKRELAKRQKQSAQAAAQAEFQKQIMHLAGEGFKSSAKTYAISCVLFWAMISTLGFTSTDSLPAAFIICVLGSFFTYVLALRAFVKSKRRIMFESRRKENHEFYEQNREEVLVAEHSLFGNLIFRDSIKRYIGRAAIVTILSTTVFGLVGVPWANSVIATNATNSESAEIRTKLNDIRNLQGAELSQYLTQSAANEMQTASADWQNVVQIMQTVNYGFEIDNNLDHVSIVKDQNLNLPQSNCESGYPSTEMKYGVTLKVAVNSSRSERYFQDRTFYFVNEDGKMRLWLDLCEIPFPGTYFYNLESLQNQLYDIHLSSSDKFSADTVICPNDSYGQTGYTFECAIQNSKGKLDGRIRVKIVYGWSGDFSSSLILN